jgi:hypothetical protein
LFFNSFQVKAYSSYCNDLVIYSATPNTLVILCDRY